MLFLSPFFLFLKVIYIRSEQNRRALSYVNIKGVLSGLRQVLVNTSALKTMKNAFTSP